MKNKVIKSKEVTKGNIVALVISCFGNYHVAQWEGGLNDYENKKNLPFNFKLGSFFSTKEQAESTYKNK